MKSIFALIGILIASAHAEDPDVIAKAAIKSSVFYSNGLSDRTEEDRQKTILNNADFHVAYFLTTDDIPKHIQIAYALRILRERVRSHSVSRNVDGRIEVDEAATQKERKRIAENIKLLEERYLELASLEAATHNGEPAPSDGDKPSN